MLYWFYHELELTHSLLCLSKDPLILVMRHVLKLQKLQQNTETLSWLFSKAEVLEGAAAIEIHSQMQAGMGGDQLEAVNYQN